MKAKLLKKIRRRVRKEVEILSVTHTNGKLTGMKIGYNDDIFKGLYGYQNSVQEVWTEAEHRYYNKHKESFKKRYHKEC